MTLPLTDSEIEYAKRIARSEALKIARGSHYCEQRGKVTTSPRQEELLLGC